MRKGFTLIELIVVISIIALLSSVVLSVVHSAMNKAYASRANQEFNAFNTAISLYLEDHNGKYPPDTNRNMPAGLEKYLATGKWPVAPWPGSFYDWDNYVDPQTGSRVYQISIRFCPYIGDINSCNFPNVLWAHNFGINSAYYYCVSGKCKSHPSLPYNYPGYCVNCAVQPSP